MQGSQLQAQVAGGHGFVQVVHGQQVGVVVQVARPSQPSHRRGRCAEEVPFAIAQVNDARVGRQRVDFRGQVAARIVVFIHRQVLHPPTEYHSHQAVFPHGFPVPIYSYAQVHDANEAVARIVFQHQVQGCLVAETLSTQRGHGLMGL